MEAYLDNSATTGVAPEVCSLMRKIMLEDYGNPSSMHKKGVDAEKYIREAKETLGGLLRVNPNEIFFTSGGTEADNMAILGTALANRRRGKHIITTGIEHPAVHEACRFLKEHAGFEITCLPVNEYGLVEPDTLKEALREDTILVSIMAVNNEIGAVEPIEELGKIIKKYSQDIVFHVDAVQGFGKVKIFPYRCNIDLMSISSHKIHGPKGVGMLFIKEKTKIKPTVSAADSRRECVRALKMFPELREWPWRLKCFMTGLMRMLINFTSLRNISLMKFPKSKAPA